MQNNFSVNEVEFANEKKLILIAGPCAVESLDHAVNIAGKIKEISSNLGIKFIYKSSFDKANRSSINSERGIGLDKAMQVFQYLKEKLGISIITDIHNTLQANDVSKYVDILQIPAFLCRQTDLLVAAASTKKPVMVKKGQFLSPWEMQNIVKKLDASNCKKIILCERGSSFGYNNLVSDMRAIPIMKKMGWPVVYDATHSVQQPGGLGESSGGNREYVPVLARAAVAVGIAGIFLETHENPDKAPSDGPNMIKIQDLELLLEKLLEIDKTVKVNV